MTLLASAADLLMVFVGIEVLSLALYILTAFAKRDLRSQEGALKYLLLGAFSSALLLYGIALAYGVAGTTNIAEAGAALVSLQAPPGMTLAAIGLLLVGFGFKTALVPFHMWTPDVYQGAPTPVTGFMAAGTKAAAFAAFLRVFVGGLAGLQWNWQPVLWAIAAVTMLAGAVLAVVQTDLKRMLSYSAVTHAGYAVIGLMAVSADGVSGTLFYLLIYAAMSLGSFGVLGVLERRQRKAMALADLAGLAQRDAAPAYLLSLFLLALAGIPGTAGFVAKFGVFRAAVETGIATNDPWLVALVVIGVVSSMIAAFFYIRVIVTMFMDAPPQVTRPELETVPLITSGQLAGLNIAAAIVIVLGILPGVVIDLAGQAATITG